MSALIHAATMVVAGVYLVARMFPLFIGYARKCLLGCLGRCFYRALCSEV